MTTDRAVKLGGKLAATALEGLPLTLPAAEREKLQVRIAGLVAELLLNVDWRVLPEDQARKSEDAGLFDGQLGLKLAECGSEKK